MPLIKQSRNFIQVPQYISEKNSILKAEYDFYNKLYTENLDSTSTTYKEALNMFTENADLAKISEEQHNMLEQKLNETDILNSLKTMKNSKSPGSDGLTAEFYKFFWIDIKNPLLDSIEHAFTKGELSIEQKRGILTLIPKKDKNRLYLKNWRPITLLNTDYKIIAKALRVDHSLACFQLKVLLWRLWNCKSFNVSIGLISDIFSS